MIAIERFWANVDKTDDGCWLWTGYTNQYGYGRLKVDRKLVQAHRFAWELLVGPIPTKWVVDHDNPDYGCGNPACVNPEHLEAVPKSLNTRRRRGPYPGTRSGVRGVTWHTQSSKWMVRTRINGVVHHGGLFTDIDEADAAAVALRELVGATDSVGVAA